MEKKALGKEGPPTVKLALGGKGFPMVNQGVGGEGAPMVKLAVVSAEAEVQLFDVCTHDPSVVAAGGDRVKGSEN